MYNHEYIALALARCRREDAIRAAAHRPDRPARSRRTVGRLTGRRSRDLRPALPGFAVRHSS
ncbi:MAG TPA: hypothetical protein VKI19_04210 [Acidimicrobiales bacterium]|nr:hypothetical protein [Acidimicrobiales bacterium]